MTGLKKELEMNGAEKDTLADIPEMFQPIVREYGRPLYTLVMAAGLGGQAATEAMEIAVRLRDPVLMKALVTLVNQFNSVSNAYIRNKGWKEETVVACDKALQAAFAAEHPVATLEPGKIILNS